MWNFIKAMFGKIFYMQETIQIGFITHRLVIDTDMFERESAKLFAILRDFHKEEEILHKADSIARETTLHIELLSRTLTSWVHFQDELDVIIHGVEGDAAVSRLQDLIVSINIQIDPRVIDVYVGRYFKQVIESLSISGRDLLPKHKEMVFRLYTDFHWIWIVSPYQIANQGSILASDLKSHTD